MGGGEETHQVWREEREPVNPADEGERQQPQRAHCDRGYTADNSTDVGETLTRDRR
jgi:hypothetical protein